MQLGWAEIQIVVVMFPPPLSLSLSLSLPPSLSRSLSSRDERRVSERGAHSESNETLHEGGKLEKRKALKVLNRDFFAMGPSHTIAWRLQSTETLGAALDCCQVIRNCSETRGRGENRANFSLDHFENSIVSASHSLAQPRTASHSLAQPRTAYYSIA